MPAPSRTVVEPGVVRGQWWHRLDDGRVQCDLCPRECKLADGQRGFCFVRQARDGGIDLTSYGRASGFCIDPIEKKPLNHFHPGTSVLSFGTAGCNLGCRFCQNWDISKAREFDRLADKASPGVIAAVAQRMNCRSVAFTYNDPVIWAEWAIDVARVARRRGIRTVFVTAGYVEARPREEIFAHMDAATVDLKGFTEGFYARYTLSHLAPVLETLEWLARRTSVWTEVTNLLIPGLNDDPGEIRRLAEWIGKHMGPDVPLHFSAFHPAWKMTDRPPTPPATLTEARRIARETGLRHVYTGNVHDPDGQCTFCPRCGKAVVRRDWNSVRKNLLGPGGACPECGERIAGVFDGGGARARSPGR